MVAYRTKDLLALALHMRPFMDGLSGFEPDTWLLNDNNIALTNGEGDYCLFEWTDPGVYFGHYFCNSRGKVAKDFSLGCIKTLFTETDCQVIKGLTPVEKKAARWMARHLGFKSYGVIDTHNGACEIFILTKKEWETD